MKRQFTFILFFLLLFAAHSQNRPLKIDLAMGIQKPINSLDLENKAGWHLGTGIRYRLRNQSWINIVQVNYDKFRGSNAIDVPSQFENGRLSNTLSLLSGYAYPIIKKDGTGESIGLYFGTNIGVSFIGHNRIHRVAKFGINPFISFEPFREVYLDLGYQNYWGGFRQTTYVGLNLRYSF